MSSLNTYTKYTYYVFLALMLLLSIHLRFENIGFLTAWFDEIGSLTHSSSANKLWTVLTNSHQDLFPPVYNLILWLNFKLFGTSIELGRSISALFGIGSIMLLYMISKNYGSRTLALLIFAITATHPYLIYYSREMRPYSALLFFSLASYYLLIINIKLKSELISFFWAITLVVAYNIHTIAIIIILHQLIRLNFSFKFTPQQKKYYLVLAMGFLYPLYLTYLATYDHSFGASKWTWISKIELHDRIRFAMSAWFGYTGFAWLLLISYPVIAIFYFLKKNNCKEIFARNWLLIDSLFVLGIVFLIDKLYFINFTDKYYICFFCLFTIGFIKFSIDEIRPKLLNYFFLLLIISVFLFNSLYNFKWSPQNENYSAALVDLHLKKPQNKFIFLTEHELGLTNYTTSINSRFNLNLQTASAASLDLTQKYYYVFTDDYAHAVKLHPELISRLEKINIKNDKLWFASY